MNVLAIDTDANTLLQLRHLPERTKVHFPSIDPDQHFDARSTIDIEEIMTKIQKLDTVEIDSILIICGLGGNMVDAISLIVPELRKSFIEPVFCLATLPCKAEGKKVSAKAADDIELIGEYIDATLLFDNETWYRHIKADTERAGGSGHVNRQKTKTTPANPRDTYRLLNDKISRMIGLLLRAGEFNEEGLEIAEVVLDAGEVLNTLKGNGIVAVGYAVQKLPKRTLSIFDRWRSERFMLEGSQERAARIVSLAKKAVYEDISVPCDLTSADKALVLIAGPTKELSMKGFQTVRKWIDRSIAGLEMRSGDYPVKNTDYVGIIIMLSGLHNIPRIEEIKLIRENFASEQALEETRAAAVADHEEGDIRDQDSEIALPKIESPAGENVGRSFFENRVSEHRLPENKRDEGQTTVSEEEYAGEETMAELSTDTGASDKKKSELEMITLTMSKDSGRKDDAIVMPGRPQRSVADMTRSTSGGDRIAPKNSVLDAKEILVSKNRPRDGQLNSDKAQVKTMPRPHDAIIDSDSLLITPAARKTSEGIINGEMIPVKSKARLHELLEENGVITRPESASAKDPSWAQVERRLKAGLPRPREIDPGPSRLKMKSRKKVEEKIEESESEAPPPDDRIFWFS